MDIFLRGNPNAIRDLQSSFNKVVYLETTSFMKTTKRKVARRLGNKRLSWDHFETNPGQPLDELFARNSEEQATWIASEFYQDAA